MSRLITLPVFLFGIVYMQTFSSNADVASSSLDKNFVSKATPVQAAEGDTALNRPYSEDTFNKLNEVNVLDQDELAVSPSRGVATSAEDSKDVPTQKESPSFLSKIFGGDSKSASSNSVESSAVQIEKKTKEVDLLTSYPEVTVSEDQSKAMSQPQVTSQDLNQEIVQSSGNGAVVASPTPSQQSVPVASVFVPPIVRSERASSSRAHSATVAKHKAVHVSKPIMSSNRVKALDAQVTSGGPRHHAANQPAYNTGDVSYNLHGAGETSVSAIVPQEQRQGMGYPLYNHP